MLNRSLFLLCSAMVLLAGSILSAQETKPGEKVPPKEPEKSNPPEKLTPKKLEDTPKAKPSLDALKVPKGTILVVVDDIKKALSLAPSLVVLTPEKFQALLDQIQTLEKQLKPEKRPVYSCKLTGKLENEFVHLKAEFSFSTEQPHTVVPLGLLGGYLVDDQDADQPIPALSYGDEGFFLKVAQPGVHKLALNMKVPVGLRRTDAAGGGERGFELGLPGASVTTLMLDLPASIKELRWNDEIRRNDNLEKKRQSGRWELSLGTIKTLNVSWKEPATLPGGGPLLSVDGQINVKVEETSTLLQADLVLVDLRGQTKDWQLVLPPRAKVEVKVPSGLIYDLQGSDGDLLHTIKFTEKHAERFSVHVQARYPRPLGAYRLPVGPFLVQNAFRQHGTITVQAPPSSLRGQRLVFHPYGEVFQRDIPKGPAAPDVAGIFQYWNMTGPTKSPSPKAPRVPLEIEWKTEKGPVETALDQRLTLRRTDEGLQLTYQARVKIKTFYAGLEYLDVQYPRMRPPPLGLFASSPVAAFPAALAWAGLLEEPRSHAPVARTTRYFANDELTGTAPDMTENDAQGKARIKFLRPSASKEFSFVLDGKYVLPGEPQRFRVEMPRLLGTLERGGKLTVSADPDMELLLGPPGVEEPVPERHQWQTAWDGSSGFVDVAWRPFQPRLPVESLVDVTLRGKHAHMRQELTFAWPRREVNAGDVLLRVPKGIRTLSAVSGGLINDRDVDKGWCWVKPTPAGGKTPLVLEYDQALPRSEKEEATWKVPMVWPDSATQVNAKVRVWSEPGMLPRFTDVGEVWRDLGSEVVAGKDALPALVLHGAGPKLDLTLRLPAAAPNQMPVVVCDRGLIQASVDEAGHQRYRARYLIQKLNTDSLDVVLPIAANTCLQKITLDKKEVPWSQADHEPKVAHLTVGPGFFRQNVLLDIEYKVPVSANENRHYFQTVVYPPVFRGEVFLGQVRWLIDLPPNWLSVLAGSDIRSDVRWTVQGWLFTPEPATTSGEAEKWLLGRETADGMFPVSQACSRSTQEPIVLVHFSRQTWLLLCSGLLLAGSLLLFFVPLSRSLFWVVLVGLGLGIVAVGFMWPSWVPPLLFGVQPGLVVLGVLLLVHWLLQERYRRQVIFMPGFTRLKPGSSLQRASGSNAKPREASTVDAPLSAQGRGSSINRGAPG